MNYSGSYRRLRDNSKAAVIGAIEIYNKPHFSYRDEVFVILLINAWGLLLKAIISKARRSIYYKKKRKQPYRTLGCRDAFMRAQRTKMWPASIPHQAILANLTMLIAYRDAAVHFYNAKGFGTIIYSLAQTSLINFRDLFREVFGQDIADEINWQILPLGAGNPIDPIAYLKGHRFADKATTAAIDEFLSQLANAIADLESEGVDTGRLMTHFDVSLQSIKKIDKADVVVGIDGSAGGGEPVYIPKTIDPAISHPYRRRQILERIGKLHGGDFSPWDFSAVRLFLDLDNKDHLCYQDDEFQVIRWSGEVVGIIRNLSAEQLERAREYYRADLRNRRDKKRAISHSKE